MTSRIRLALITSVLLGCAGTEATPPTDEDVGDDETDAATDTTDTGDPCVEEPTNSVELTNACTDATCEPFANTPERLPLLEPDGKLPPLP